MCKHGIKGINTSLMIDLRQQMTYYGEIIHAAINITAQLNNHFNRAIFV